MMSREYIQDISGASRLLERAAATIEDGTRDVIGNEIDVRPFFGEAALANIEAAIEIAEMARDDLKVLIEKDL